MSDKPTHSRIRIALAQYMMANNLELDELYDALGISVTNADQSALSHIAGVIDGMNLAVNRIRQHGLDDWAKS